MRELGFDPGGYVDEDRSPGASAARRYMHDDHSAIAKEAMRSAGDPSDRRSAHSPSSVSRSRADDHAVKDFAVALMHTARTIGENDDLARQIDQANGELTRQGRQAAERDVVFANAYADQVDELENAPPVYEDFHDEWDAQLAGEE